MPHRCVLRQKGLACEMIDDDEAAMKAVIAGSMNDPSVNGRWLDTKATSKGQPPTKKSVEERQAKPSTSARIAAVPQRVAAALLQELQPSPPPQPTRRQGSAQQLTAPTSKKSSSVPQTPRRKKVTMMEKKQIMKMMKHNSHQPKWPQ